MFLFLEVNPFLENFIFLDSRRPPRQVRYHFWIYLCVKMSKKSKNKHFVHKYLNFSSIKFDNVR
jgi:hypothetical protein